MAVTVSEDDIWSRTLVVQEILKPLSQVQTGPAVFLKKAATTVTLIAGDDAETNGIPRYARFRTPKRDLRGNYFEIWELEGNDLKLSKSYLHLYLRTREQGEIELIALHCDADEADDLSTSSQVYKAGPHLHVKSALPPLHKCHFALTACNLTDVLTSTGALTDALGILFKMMRDEVLDRY